jgi:hypothetical protein
MEKNEISKALKKKLNDAGLTHLRVQGGKGTAWGWMDVLCGKDDHSFTESDQAKLFEIGMTDRPTYLSNCIIHRLSEWEAIINKPKHDANLELLKNLFYNTASQKADMGTCCGGSGVFVYKDGKKIDFWNNTFAMSSDPLVETINELENTFTDAGYSLVVEHGWMD